MRIHDHFHKLAILYVSELLFSFIFCPSAFVFVTEDRYCLLNQELYGMLKPFFYFMQDF